MVISDCTFEVSIQALVDFPAMRLENSPHAGQFLECFHIPDNAFRYLGSPNLFYRRTVPVKMNDNIEMSLVSVNIQGVGGLYHS